MQFILNKNIYRLQRKPFGYLPARVIPRGLQFESNIFCIYETPTGCFNNKIKINRLNNRHVCSCVFVCFSCEAFLWHTGTVLWLELDVSDICYNWSMKWFYFQKLKFWNNNRRFFRFQETDDLARKSNLTFLCKLLVPPAHHPLFNLVNILRLIRKCIKKFYVIAVKHFTE